MSHDYPFEVLDTPGSVVVAVVSVPNVKDQIVQLLPLLSEEETQRVPRFRFERDANHYTIGRALLRSVLSQLCQTSHAELTIAEGTHGRPFCTQANQRNLDFNTSHSGDRVILALASGARVGVDVERASRDTTVSAVSKRLAPEEQDSLNALPEAARALAFRRCWTRKEAVMKALGSGLSLGLEQFAVSLDDAQPRLVRAPPATASGSVTAPDWQLLDIDVGPDHSAAVALTRRVSRAARIDVTGIINGVTGRTSTLVL